MFKRSAFAATLSALLLSAPVMAEEPRGEDLLERGARMFLEGLMKEMEPALNDLQDLSAQISPSLRGFVTEMGPAIEGLMRDIKDWSAYHPPEILDNGDIIIRKRRPEDIQDGAEIEI